MLCGSTQVLGSLFFKFAEGSRTDVIFFYLSFNKQRMPALLDGHSTLTPRIARSSLVLRDFWVFRKISYKTLA